jgi:hypothetical protein
MTDRPFHDFPREPPHGLAIISTEVPESIYPEPHERLTDDAPFVPCTYCRASIPAASFAFLTPAKRLLTAPCPGCHRQTTLAVATWRRWSILPGKAVA